MIAFSIFFVAQACSLATVLSAIGERMTVQSWYKLLPPTCCIFLHPTFVELGRCVFLDGLLCSDTFYLVGAGNGLSCDFVT